MSTETVTVELSEDLYRRLKGAAAGMHQPLETIIYQTIRGNLPPTLEDLPAEQHDLVADLQGLGDEELWAAARQPLPVMRWRHHQRLLRQAETGGLTDAQRRQLAGLRDATDRFVIRRSYALALLKWRGHTIPLAL